MLAEVSIVGMGTSEPVKTHIRDLTASENAEFVEELLAVRSFGLIIRPILSQMQEC